jgi:hypothetical protein
LACLSLLKTNHTSFRIVYCFDDLNYSKRKANIANHCSVNTIHIFSYKWMHSMFTRFKVRNKSYKVFKRQVLYQLLNACHTMSTITYFGEKNTPDGSLRSFH